jgi:hypothetical protein
MIIMYSPSYFHIPLVAAEAQFHPWQLRAHGPGSHGGATHYAGAGEVVHTMAAKNGGFVSQKNQIYWFTPFYT